MRLRRVVGAAIAASLLVVAACGPTPQAGGGAAGAGARVPARGTGGASPLAPGRTVKRGGRVEVVGTLQREDGGQWVVVAALPPEASAGHIIAVILNPTALRGGDLVPLENSYVRVTGTPSGGIATNAADTGIVASEVVTLTAR